MPLLRRLSLAVGIVAVVAGVVWLARPGNELAELASAVGEHRPVEPRLSGGFRYAPLSRTRAVDSSPAETSADVRIAVGRLEKRSSARTSTPTAALGVAYLVTGDAARAVLALEEAVDRPSPPAGALSDLSAAYLVRSAAPQHAQDLARALTIAERAVNAEPKRPEAWFNRALALDALSLRDAAREAWQAYLRVDSASGWADEAREHIQRLSDAAGPSPRDMRRQADAAISRSDRSAIEQLVAGSPQVVRDAVDDQLFVEWPRLVSAGRQADARAVVDRLEPPTTELARQRDDAFYADCLEEVRLASRDAGRANELAGLLRGYRTGADAYNEDRIADSARRFQEFIPRLERAGSPLAWSAKRYAAIGAFYSSQYASALDAVRTIVDAPATVRYPRLRGQALRLGGLIHANRGDYAPALADYEGALQLFQSAGDADNEASVYAALAENYHFLGDSTQAWTAWNAALARVGGTQELRSRYVILQAASYAALREELPEAAFYLQAAALANAREWSRPPAVLAGILNRAEIHKRLGRSQAAVDDLSEAERFLASVHDPLLTSRNEARIWLARGETTYHEAPAAAVEALTKALAYFEKTGAGWRLAGAYLARGRAHLAAAQSDLAEQDFQAGITAFERMRASISSEALRSSYFEQPWDLFTEMIRLQVQRGDSQRALRFAEQARARTLLDALNTTTAGVDLPADFSRELPSGAVIVYYAALDDRLLIWTLARGRQTFVQQQIRQVELARLLARYTATTGSRDAAVLATLYDHLIRPVAGDLPTLAQVIVVPDGVLHGVPFAGLIRRETGRFVIQDHAVATAPSLLTYLRSTRRSADGAALRALVVGNPALDRTVVALPDAAGEAREIAALYTDSKLLLDAAATKRTFESTAGSFDVVHFAGHAVSNVDYPALSNLRLAGMPGDSNGMLFAHEIANIPFERTRLVVLAACQTSAGRIRRGEGVFNLARPFLAAGVPAVVASLWDVDDRATRALFVAFHRALSGGATPADALRAAQIGALEQSDPQRRDPANWASFAVIY